MAGRRHKLKSTKVPLGSNAAKPEADSTTEPEPAAKAKAQVDGEGLGEAVGAAAPTAPPPAASLTAPTAAAPIEQQQQQPPQLDRSGAAGAHSLRFVLCVCGQAGKKDESVC
jgi:hypothetical protein